MMFKAILKPVSRRGGVLAALMQRRRPSRPGVFSLGSGGDAGDDWHDPPSTPVSQRRAARHVRIERVDDDWLGI